MNKFIDIDLELLRIDTILGVDLYLKTSSGFVLYRSRNIPFNEKVRGNLLSHGVQELYIPSTESAKFTRYIENNLSSILADEKISDERKRQVAYESSLNIAEELIQNPTSPTVVKRATRIVEGLVNLHQKDDGGFQKIVQLMSVDYSIISHSANVATYSISIGKSLGISRNDLYELGIGALLHDIGKSKVPTGILNKAGKLTSDEFKIMKEHVSYGLKMASNNPVVPRQSLIPILNHHERLTGIGYPYGKSSSDIPLFGLITAVADSFDAMTTNRVYQEALSTFKALEILLTQTDNYDLKVLSGLLKLMGPGKSNIKLKNRSMTDSSSQELPEEKLVV